MAFDCTDKSKTNRNEQLAGMYKLYNIQVQDSAGLWHDEWEINGTRYIVYYDKGHISVQITPKGYNKFKWLSEGESFKPEKVTAKMESLSVQELKEAPGEFASDYVYVATYSNSDSSDIVILNRLSHTIPSAWNATVKRRFIFNGDTL